MSNQDTRNWVLRNATADSEGNVQTWDWSPKGDGCYDGMPLGDIASNEIDMMDDSSENRVIVDEKGKVLKWIMNSPKGQRRVWDDRWS